jgi:hypothetical protein
VIAQPEGWGAVSADSIAAEFLTPVTASGNVLTVGECGTSVATPADPDGEYTYRFVGWTIPEESVTGNMTVIASFERDPIEYTVTFAVSPEGAGTVSTGSIAAAKGTQVYPYADRAYVGEKYSSAKAAEDDSRYTYEFVGWDIPSPTVQGDMTVTALFRATPVMYAVRVVFTCGGEEIASGVNSSQAYGSEYSYSVGDYPYAPGCFEGYRLVSPESQTLTVRENPQDQLIANVMEFEFERIYLTVTLSYSGDGAYSVSETVAYGERFDRIVQAYGSDVGKSIVISSGGAGEYHSAEYDVGTLQIHVIDGANSEVIFGPITEDVSLYYYYV